MHGFWQTRGLTRKRVFAGLAAVLVFALITPSAIATSIVAQAEPDEDEQAPAATPFRSITSNQIQFLEDNWYFGIDDLMIEEADREPAAADQRVMHDQIKFLEDNWHLGADSLGLATDDVSGTHVPMTRAEMYFIEQNIEFGPDAGERDNEPEDEVSESDSSDVETNLPHPWGGDSTELDW